MEKPPFLSDSLSCMIYYVKKRGFCQIHGVRRQILGRYFAGQRSAVLIRFYFFDIFRLIDREIQAVEAFILRKEHPETADAVPV